MTAESAATGILPLPASGRTPTAARALLLTFVAYAAVAVPRAACCGPEGLPEAVLREVSEPARLPQGRYVSVAQWQAAKGALHLTGREVTDPSARARKAWEARPGVHKARLPLLYGPYLDMPAGDYVAFFRLMLLDDVGEDAVADLDAAVGFGQTICGVRYLRGSDLPARRWAFVPLAFRSPGGKLEGRVHWHGAAGLRADSVQLFRLEGGSIDAAQVRVANAKPSG